MSITTRSHASRTGQVRPARFPLRLPRTGQIVGFIRKRRDGTRVFERGVYPAEHMHRQPRGWALEVQLVELLQAERIQRLRMVEREGPRRWTASFRRFLRHSFPIHHAGCSEQLLLPERFWAVREVSPMR